MDMEWYLPLIWAGIIGIAVAMYVVMDGFDLGIGILFPTSQSEAERDQMMRSIAPFWDGNETWLVLGGAGLFVAFPLAYAIIMPAFYLPVIVMLLALVFRGVAFEFRIVSDNKPWWNAAFTGGSVVATLCQGLILGGMIQGINVRDGAYAGGTFDWATPFAMLCALSLIAGYALLGATWLTMKTEGPVADRSRAQAKVLLLVVLGFMAAVSLYTPLSQDRIFERWFTLPNFYYLWPIPLVTGAAGLRLLALADAGPRRAAVSCRHRAVHARLRRAGGVQLPLSGAAVADGVGHRGRALEPDLHAGRHAGDAADHPRLCRLHLLDLPRQGARGRELSLAAATTAPCGRSTDQPSLICGRRPCTMRGKARGASGSISGN